MWCAGVLYVALLLAAPPAEDAATQVDAMAIELPAPATRGGMSLNQALAERRSRRAFDTAALELEQLGQLCWAAQGVTRQDRGYRTAPSAGALYPLELRLLTAEGMFRYDPGGHRLERLTSEDRRAALQRHSAGRGAVETAPLVVAISIDVGRTATKYGARAERYALLEAGHAAQNLLLGAVALGLRAVPIGAFDDAAVAKRLELPERLDPVYLIPVGRPPGSGR